MEYVDDLDTFSDENAEQEEQIKLLKKEDVRIKILEEKVKELELLLRLSAAYETPPSGDERGLL